MVHLSFAFERLDLQSLGSPVPSAGGAAWISSQARLAEEEKPPVLQGDVSGYDHLRDGQVPPAGIEPATYGLGNRVLEQAQMALSSLAARLYSNRLLLQEPEKRSKNMRESSVFRRFLRRIPYSFSWVVRSGAITRPSFLLSLTTATHRPIDHALASLIETWPTLPPDTRTVILAIVEAAQGR